MSTVRFATTSLFPPPTTTPGLSFLSNSPSAPIFLTHVLNDPFGRHHQLMALLVLCSSSSSMPAVFQVRLVNALYECDYKAYLHAMVDLHPFLIADRFFQPHAGYIMRELHVLGYKQFLDSYKSVRLDSMANSFGVSVDFLDLQLSRFIAAGRLTAKIDKFGGVVETNRPDLKNAQYREMIQKGDGILNRIAKLARDVDL